MGYRVDWEEDGSGTYGNGTMIQLARLDAWIASEVTTMDTEMERGRRGKTLFTILYRRYLRRAIVGMLKEAWEVVKDMHAVEYNKDGMEDEERRAVYGSSDRTVTVAL